MAMLRSFGLAPIHTRHPNFKSLYPSQTLFRPTPHAFSSTQLCPRQYTTAEEPFAEPQPTPVPRKSMSAEERKAYKSAWHKAYFDKYYSVPEKKKAILARMKKYWQENRKEIILRRLERERIKREEERSSTTPSQ